MSYEYKFLNRDAVIIQCGHTNNMFIDMLRLTIPRHTAYALSHGMDYWPIFGNPCPERTTGAWDKVYWVKYALSMHYQYVIWLDTDAAIMNFEVDLRDALKDCELGAVEHDPDKSEYLKVNEVPRHCNVGVTYYKNTPLVKEFVDEWWASYPGVERWLEQGKYNEMIETEKYKGIFKKLDDTWNSTIGVNVVPKPVIAAWHGIIPWAKRLEMMKEFLKKDLLEFSI